MPKPSGRFPGGTSFRTRLTEIFFRALQRLLGRVGGQKSFGYILLWIGVCAAAVLIAYWIFRNWFRAAQNAEMALQAAVVPLRSWQEWVYAARDAAERGDYRGAIHCAYWSGVTRLQDLGALAPDRAKTPREYLGALSKSKILQPETYAVRKQALSALTSGWKTSGTAIAPRPKRIFANRSWNWRLWDAICPRSGRPQTSAHRRRDPAGADRRHGDLFACARHRRRRRNSDHLLDVEIRGTGSLPFVARTGLPVGTLGKISRRTSVRSARNHFDSRRSQRFSQ